MKRSIDLDDDLAAEIDRAADLDKRKLHSAIGTVPWNASRR